MRYLKVRDIDEMADKIKDPHLECRVHMHSRYSASVSKISGTGRNAGLFIDATGTERKAPKQGLFLKTLHCRNRCGVVWTQVLDATGKVLWETGADYHSAPGYLVKGVGRLSRESRDRLRLEQAQRWIDKKGKGKG
jgi:hypothetical protein